PSPPCSPRPSGASSRRSPSASSSRCRRRGGARRPWRVGHPPAGKDFAQVQRGGVAMSEAVLAAQRRSETGKQSARSLRRAGRVPGVLYGGGQGPTPVAVDARQLERLVQGAGAHGLIELQLDNGNGPARHQVLIKELQRDPVYGTIQHV